MDIAPVCETRLPLTGHTPEDNVEYDLTCTRDATVNTDKSATCGRTGMPTIGILVLSLLLHACTSTPARNPVPEELVHAAAIPGVPYARMWGDELPPALDERLEVMRQQMQDSGEAGIFDKPHHYLTISGGGLNGAFGAGLLKGWSESGMRPEFWIVTGISTGALIAPFAFLGSDYDDELESLFTGISTSDILRQRRLLIGLTSDAIMDNTPLRELLKTHIDQEMVEAIAARHNSGRRLTIGTTNLDTQRPVIWNIGAIAQAGTPESRQLIRDIMLASTSIPGVFPPVRINAQADDQMYDELHVDGGTSSQVFLYPAEVDIHSAARTVGFTAEQSVYVIRNAALAPRWSPVKPKLIPVVRASIATLIRTQGLGDLYRIYLGAVRDKMQFKLAYIPADFTLDPQEGFDQEYMKALFDLAYELARDGYEWTTSPPGIGSP
jgi:predicted acylesterase/phospholipase RssA